MNKFLKTSILLFITFFIHCDLTFAQKAINPIIHADVPDVSMIRVGDTYYMSSTTMHVNPGVPIMKSKDLINWELVSYAYQTLGDSDDLTLSNDKNMYGKGSWASSLRYHEGKYYVSTFSGNTHKTYIYSTEDIENGPWEAIEFRPSLHDHTLFFEDGKAYMIWGAGEIKMVELESDLSGIKADTERVLIEKAHEPIKEEIMLPAEGTQLFKVKGKYYLFNIAWPRGGMRTVIVHKADNLFGPYEGRVALQDKGVAQGGLIDTPEGDWYSFLFRDNGAVGRIPYLVPVRWENDWPVLGENGKVPMELDLPASKGLMPGIVASDDFKRKKREPALPLVWQWNHNPVDELWAIDGKKGKLSLKTDRTDQSVLTARNTLTQRTIGPKSMGTIKLDVSKMKEGDWSGLTLLQKDFGLIGVKMLNGQKHLVMQRSEDTKEAEIESVPFNGKSVLLRAICDFEERKDEAKFYYSVDNGTSWEQLGDTLKMKYSLPHFMGYRFGLFYYATSQPGGQVDFDYFQIDDQIKL
ncbi:glycoside hydrolase 43 family protein [Belliella sp. DSM 111904]|uniref:Glycoside hydrolase 43 family protein n=1 Tax=Belliella filtrata TaxID=2923435 RepID=A0ABS9V2A1_9BACT|nr:glycoside hydrolase 43 family protein [Belliella filtrata]MCH7410538.1 glycoside hydrolase 43 family protein [Belliella filtrata]